MTTISYIRANIVMKMKRIIAPTLVIFSIVLFSGCSSNGANSVEGTESCLVGYDWVYPNGSNPSGAWKFSGDGTFNSSTVFFGGMSTWGNWTVIEPGKILVSYTRTSEGIIPSDQILLLEQCGSLKVGSTIYIKD